MGKTNRVSACVICQNNAGTIEHCLKSLGFCDEIVVVDGCSTDGTYETAARYATVIRQHAFDTTAAQRTRAYDLASGEWIFWLDTDEEVTAELAGEIRETLRPDAGNLPDGFRIRRRWHYPTSWGGSGDFTTRHVHLFRKSAARFGPVGSFHVTPQPTNPATWRTASLKGIIEHWPWRDINDILSRVQRYALTDAEVLAANGKRSGPMRMLAIGLWRFLRYYFIKGGFLHGAPGFYVAWALSSEALLKYARLWEIERQRQYHEDDASARARKDGK